MRPAGMVIIRAGLLQARLGHQLDHHLVVDSNKIGGKAGVGLAKVFFIDAGGKEVHPEAGLDVELLGPQGEMGNFHGKPPGRNVDNQSRADDHACYCSVLII